MKPELLAFILATINAIGDMVSKQEACDAIEREWKSLLALDGTPKKCFDCEKPVDDPRYDLCSACDRTQPPLALPVIAERETEKEKP